MSSLFERLGAEILAEMFEVAAHGLALLNEAGEILHVNARGADILGVKHSDAAGGRLFSYVAPASRQGAIGWYFQSLQGAVVPTDITIERPDELHREASCFCVPVMLEGRRSGLLALHDVTESRRAQREARTLSQLAASLNLTTSLYAIADQIAECVRDSTTSLACAVYLADAASGPRLIGAAGLNADVPALAEALASELSRRELAGFEVETFDLERPAQGLGAAGAKQPGSGHVAPWLDVTPEQARSGAVVPLVYRGNRIGSLLVFFSSDRHGSAKELAFIRSLADSSVIAIENARLFSAAQDKAALEERQRLARELHDSVSQALYGIALGARSARSQLGVNPERVGERLDYVLRLAEAAVTEMRALIFELRPETLAAEGLAGALAKQATALSERHHVAVDLRLADEPDAPLAVKEALYRISQEALHNVVKHAAARRVTVALTVDGGHAKLEVADDGVGFNPAGAFYGHFGLSSMRERAELLGGTFTLNSQAGAGTRIEVLIPTSHGH